MKHVPAYYITIIKYQLILINMVDINMVDANHHLSDILVDAGINHHFIDMLSITDHVLVK